MAAEKSVYEKLSEKIMAPGSVRIPKLFAMLVDARDAEILLALPGAAPGLAAQFNMSQEDMAAKLHGFFLKGLAFKSKKGDVVRYRLCRDVAQFHDATILWPGAGRDYYNLWQEYMENEWPEYTKLVEKFLPRPFTRLIPVEQSIQAGQKILPYESCKELIESSTKIAVTKCTCRLIAHKCDNPIEVCLQIGKAAEYNLERGTGQEISKEEALGIIRQCELAGLMHVTMNKSENMHFICNCCGCCCMAMPMMIQYGRRMNDPSRFVAQVDADACEVCGACVDRCWFKAITVLPDADFALVDEERCVGCGICQVTCPAGAISLAEIRNPSFIPA
jgi:NAD-dependent dihydropyrimidine dehydrogenase PreA subunit